MQAYWYLVRMKVQVGLTYRFEVFAVMATQMIVMVASVYLWNNAFTGQSSLAGLDRSQMVNYAVLAVVLSSLFQNGVQNAIKVEKLKTDKASILKTDGNKVWCSFDHHRFSASDLITELAKELDILDLSVHDADIEDAVGLIYKKEVEIGAERGQI